MGDNSRNAYEVHPYSLDRFIELTAKLSRENTDAAIRGKPQPGYLDKYFKHVGVKTIILENHYVDRDYLEDFAAYYVRCFESYDRSCARLHFFDHAFDDNEFRKILNAAADSDEMKAFQSAYCGFIVIKPLPLTVFGRTCLRTYESQANRYFPTARSFSANLFGIPLVVSQTLPFQEQDSVVAACATSALWSVLQATAKEFLHGLWTPIAITKAATDLSPAETRMIPNRGGLSAAMMAEAIRTVGLEPLLLDVPADDEDTLRAALYAYIRGRIPVLMGIGLIDTCVRGKPRIIGEHAIAVTGYKLTDPPKTRRGSAQFRQRATRMEKIYVHDDQLGPFARMEFDGVKVKQKAGKRRTVASQSLSTSWRSADGSENVRAVPTLLLVPLYHKIRIPYADVFQAVIELDGFLKTLSLPRPLVALRDVEWDIHLTTVNDFKTDLQRSAALRGPQRLRWLTRSMPRFLWRATAYDVDSKLLDILFDATDIHTSNGVNGVIFYDANVEKVISMLAKSPALGSIDDLGEGARRILANVARSHA